MQLKFILHVDNKKFIFSDNKEGDLKELLKRNKTNKNMYISLVDCKGNIFMDKEPVDVVY